MSNRLRGLSVVLPVFCLTAYGDNPGDGRIDAMLAAWTGDDVACDVVYTHSANDGPIFTESYSLDEGWSLVAVNDAPPTAEELDAYRSDSSRQSREHRSAPGFNLSQYIDPESSTIESEDDETLTITYAPGSGDEREDLLLRKMGVKMRGRLTVEKGNLQPLTMTIELTEPISVAVPPVRIVEYREARSFVVDSATGTLLVDSFTLLSRGRAFFVRKVGNSVAHQFSYSGCQFVGVRAR